MVRGPSPQGGKNGCVQEKAEEKFKAVAEA